VELGELTLEQLRPFGEEFGADFFAAVSLNATLDCHDVLGGTARQRVRQSLAAASERIARIAGINQGETAHVGA
jgi:argininosuccinate lyase